MNSPHSIRLSMLEFHEAWFNKDPITEEVVIYNKHESEIISLQRLPDGTWVYIVEVNPFFPSLPSTNFVLIAHIEERPEHPFYRILNMVQLFDDYFQTIIQFGKICPHPNQNGCDEDDIPKSMRT